MNKKLIILTFILLYFSFINLYAQVAINNDGTQPDQSAGLDINFPNKGILIPRIALNSANDASTIPNPATSLIVYNDGSGGLTPAGFYYNAGDASNPNWVRLPNSSQVWLLNGNAGTTPGTNFLGTTDNADLDIRTNNIIRWRFKTSGVLEFLNNGKTVSIGEGAGANDDQSDNANVNIGYYANKQNTSGAYIVAIGYKALENNTNDGQTAVGAFALNSQTTGECNTAVGYGALYLNTEGNRNTALGYRALRGNTNTDDNTAVGYGTLRTNNAIRNTAVGAFAMNNNTTGKETVAMGYGALYLNTTGTQNVAIGYNSMRNNTTSSDYNVAVGFEAMYYSQKNNDFNVAIGYQAMRNENDCYDDVNFNTAVGAYSIYGITTGDNNAALGYQSAYNITDGSYNTAIGNFALYNLTNGQYNTALGYRAGQNYDGFQRCTFLGDYAAANASNFSNSTAVGNQATITASNQIRIGNSSVTSIGGYVNWSNISDKRFKINIKEDVPGLKFIMLLKPITYNLDIQKINEFLNIPDSLQNMENITEKQKIRYSGFIAQDVQKAAESIGYDFSGVDKPKNPNDTYALRYADFVVPLVKAVQEQQMIIQQQQAQITELKRQNQQILQRLKKLEKQNKR